MITPPILTTELIHFSLNGWENLPFEFGRERLTYEWYYTLYVLGKIILPCCYIKTSDTATTVGHKEDRSDPDQFLRLHDILIPPDSLKKYPEPLLVTEQSDISDITLKRGKLLISGANGSLESWTPGCNERYDQCFLRYNWNVPTFSSFYISHGLQQSDFCRSNGNDVSKWSKRRVKQRAVARCPPR